jgi:hypothetical protein
MVRDERIPDEVAAFRLRPHPVGGRLPYCFYSVGMAESLGPLPLCAHSAFISA